MWSKKSSVASHLYLSIQTIGPNRISKITAKVLAQHHCSPPPASSLMALWLNALRKRHATQYNSMQTEMKEIQYSKEREGGYRESVDNDMKRKEREAKEEAERLIKEEAEIERMVAIQKRREELKSSLPPEDKSGKAKTVALRFPDGRSGQRKFAPDTPLSTVFDWVDAMFEIEREKLVLTTLNGKQEFSWDDEDGKTKTLEQAGLGRKTGLRVTEKKPEASEKKVEESRGEDSQ
jgi:Skp family chaperone for outer membrane proteins